MRNFNLFFLSLFTCFLTSIGPISAQIVKGSFRLGPDVSFSSNTTEIDQLDLKIKNNSLQLGAQFGYYIIDNLEIGVGLSYLSNKSEVDDTEETSSGIALGPLVEYKIGIGPQYYFTLGGGMTYNSVTNEDDFGEVTYTGISYRLFGGLEFVVNNKLGAFLSIGPEFGTFKDADSDSEFDLTNIGIGMGFGFYF